MRVGALETIQKTLELRLDGLEIQRSVNTVVLLGSELDLGLRF